MPDPATDNNAINDRASLYLLGAWVLATGASLGSLFFSEIMELPPCSLCWYQRCFMFPLAIVLLIGVLRSDRSAVHYALPISIGGLLVAAYHVLVSAGIIPESAAPCQAGISCSEIQFQLFGVFSIPVMSLLAFIATTALLIACKRSAQR